MQWNCEFILKEVLSRDSHVDAKYAAYGIAGLEERFEHGYHVDGANQVAVIKFAFPALWRAVIKYILDHGIIIGEIFDGNDILEGLIDDFVGLGKSRVCGECVVAPKNGKVAVDPKNTDVREIE